MKKLFLFAAILLTSYSATNAQFFAGGGIGFQAYGGTTDDGTRVSDNASAKNFTFSPIAGYFFNDKFAAGLELNLNTNNSSTPNGTNTNETTKTTFAFSPFARYYFAKFKDLSFFAQGTIRFVTGSSETTTAGTITKDPDTSGFGFDIAPALSYSVSDHFNLETSLNFLNLSYYRNVSEHTVAGRLTKDVDNRFNFGAGLNNIVTLGTITVSAIYKF